MGYGNKTDEYTNKIQNQDTTTHTKEHMKRQHGNKNKTTHIHKTKTNHHKNEHKQNVNMGTNATKHAQKL